MLPVTLIAPIVKSLPLAEIVPFVNTLLNHSANMARIEKEYQYKRQELKYHYKLESQRIESQLKAFKVMAKHQQHRFEIGHKERKEILKTMRSLATNPIPANQQLMARLMEGYEQSLQDSVGLALPSTNQMIEGGR